MAARETDRRDLISRFMYHFWLLNKAQSHCRPRNSTGTPALEAVEASPIRPDWKLYFALINPR